MVWSILGWRVGISSKKNYDESPTILYVWDDAAIRIFHIIISLTLGKACVNFSLISLQNKQHKYLVTYTLVTLNIRAEADAGRNVKSLFLLLDFNQIWHISTIINFVICKQTDRQEDSG
jgi:hypothetical protein